MKKILFLFVFMVFASCDASKSEADVVTANIIDSCNVDSCITSSSVTPLADSAITQ
jgi:hypothetical protein